MLWFMVIWCCQLNFAVSKARSNVSLVNTNNKWYGPSYRPSWWVPDETVGLRGSSDFGYDGTNAPDTWPGKFSDCGGDQQSPINISTKDLKNRKTRKSLKWTNYDVIPRRVVVENSGHSIHANGIWKNSDDIPHITNGPLENRYYFSQLHFHWGRNSSKGSEHTVNMKSYPLEMHVVHDRKVEDPTNLSQEDNSDHLVVVSYMFEVTKSDNPALNPILKGATEVQGRGKKKTNIKPFRLSDLVETFNGEYVTYQGSLTTPPCTEGVIWIVSSKPLGVSENQLTILRNSVKNQNGGNIRNYRPVQKVNGRNVYYISC